jgi:hypothetical protein
LEDYIFWELDEKSNKKIKTDACFTRKTGARKAEIPKLLPSVVKQWVFLRFSHLFFGSLSKVGRLRDLENLTGRFADNHI